MAHPHSAIAPDTTELLAVAFITILAVISLGADFAMTTRNSLLHGRRANVLRALDITLGVQVHVFYTMFDMGLLITHAPTPLHGIELVGVTYLMWIGQKALSAKSLPSDETAGNSVDVPTLSTFTVLRTGFLTNVLDPKTTLLVVSTYTQVVHAGVPLLTQFGYGLFVSAAYTVWLVLMAAAFVSGALRRSLLARQCIVDGVIGMILIGLELALGPVRLV